MILCVCLTNMKSLIDVKGFYASTCFISFIYHFNLKHYRYDVFAGGYALVYTSFGDV